MYKNIPKVKKHFNDLTKYDEAKEFFYERLIHEFKDSDYPQSDVEYLCGEAKWTLDDWLYCICKDTYRKDVKSHPREWYKKKYEYLTNIADHLIRQVCIDSVKEYRKWNNLDDDVDLADCGLDNSYIIDNGDYIIYATLYNIPSNAF